jgi:hypothetical protein
VIFLLIRSHNSIGQWKIILGTGGNGNCKKQFWPLLLKKCIELDHGTMITVMHDRNPSQPCTAHAKSIGKTRIMVKATRNSEKLDAIHAKPPKKSKVRHFSNFSRYSSLPMAIQRYFIV